MSYLYYQSEPRLSFGEPPAAPAATAVLEGRTSLQRGMQGTYVVKNVPTGATFSEWTFSDGRKSYRRPGNNNVNSWAGEMVQSGTISVKMKEPGGSQRVLVLRVAVTPRAWSENAAQVPLPRSGHGRLPTEPRINRPGLDPRDAGTGTSTVVGVHDIQTKVVQSGPNEGFNFVIRPPVRWEGQAFSNNALYDPSHPFFRAHDPSRRRTWPAGRLKIDVIRTNVEAHEGIIVPPAGAPRDYASHQQKLLNYLRANPINSVVERDVAHISVESNVAYGTRILKQVKRQIEAGKAASKGHPDDIFRGDTYFNYPYIHSRSLRLLVGGSSGRLSVTNPPGRTRWTSSDPKVVTIDGNGTVRPVSAGRAIIRVTNADNEIDEIPVTVTNR